VGAHDHRRAGARVPARGEPGSERRRVRHDPIREGHVVEHEPLLCVSTSFGCHDGDKVFLEWDLANKATTAEEVARTGLRRLYPDSPPRYRAIVYSG